MAKCKETAGVLFPHPCTREAVSACTECQKAVCDLHNRNGRCIQCFRANAPSNDGTDPFLMARHYYPDYDTGGTSAPGLRRALENDLDPGDEAFESDFDGT